MTHLQKTGTGFLVLVLGTGFWIVCHGRKTRVPCFWRRCIIINSSETKDLKTAHGHMMPPTLHLSDIRCKCFPYRRCHGKQQGAMNEQKMKVSMSAVERYHIITC